MSQRVCETCSEEFDYNTHLPRQVECGCVRCEKCLKIVYRSINHYNCEIHNQKTFTHIDKLRIFTDYLQSESFTRHQQDQKCKVHTQELKYFCQDDKIQVCEQCINQVHQNHFNIPIQQKLQEQKLSLQQIVKVIEQKINQRLFQTESSFKNLIQQKNQANKKMVLYTNKLQKQICTISKSL